MQPNSSIETLVAPSAAAGRAPAARRIGMALFALGAVYLLVVSWLASWWVVPAMREAGLHSFDAVIMIWAVSAPLGALIVAAGGSLVAAERRLWFWLAGTAVIVLWSATGPIKEVVPALFGIGGGLILLFFLGSAWNWVRRRPFLAPAARQAADVQMIGHVFFFVAAWNLCGLLGAPAFVLRSGLTEQFDVSVLAVGLGSTVLISFTLGWACLYLSQQLAARQEVKA